MPMSRTATPTSRHPSVAHLLDFLTTPSTFDITNAPPVARVVHSVNYTAHEVAGFLGDGPELSTGLRHLLDAQACFVRQAALDERAAEADDEQSRNADPTP